MFIPQTNRFGTSQDQLYYSALYIKRSTLIGFPKTRNKRYQKNHVDILYRNVQRKCLLDYT